MNDSAIHEHVNLFRQRVIGPYRLVFQFIVVVRFTTDQIRSLAELLPIARLGEINECCRIFPRTGYGWSQLPAVRPSYDPLLTVDENWDVRGRPYGEDREKIDQLRHLMTQRMEASGSGCA